MSHGRFIVLLLGVLHVWSSSTLTSAQPSISANYASLLTEVQAAVGIATAAANVSERSNGPIPLTSGQLQYVPAVGTCNLNITTFIRQEEALEEELDWVDAREALTSSTWVRYLNALNLEDAADYLLSAEEMPRIAIALSGGGYRAALVGAGVLQAFDERNSSSVEAGSGGILQLSAYLLGLSGGAWTTASLAEQNGVSVDNWAINTTHDLFYPGSSLQEAVSNEVIFLAQAKAKQDAGFNVSLVDLWGRCVCFAMMTDNDDCAGTTFSSLLSQPAFKNYAFPLPIILAAARFAYDAPKNSSLPFEFTPFTSGVSTTGLVGWMPTELLGTSYDAGEITSLDACVTGFDNIGWVSGASSLNLDAYSSQAQAAWAAAGLNLEGPYNFLLETAGPMPNPYKGLEGADYDNIYLADGGLGMWGILPLHPALIESRQVDVLFVVDASADSSYNWPTGDALVEAASYAAVQGLPFPAIPSSAYFHANPVLSTNISFFGCGDTRVPTIVYIPNRQVTFPSNTSSYKNVYSVDEKNGMIGNGWALVTAGDAPACMGCLLVSVTGYSSAQCDECLARYCWEPASFMDVAVPAT